MAVLTAKKFGLKTGRDYHKREMESYLRRRKHDSEGERPLLESSVRQSYIGYKKSSVVMYALQDYISEDSVGKALGRIVEKFGYRLDTFALASDLITPTPFGDGSQVRLGGFDVTVRSMQGYQNVFRGRVENVDYVFNRFGSPIGALSRHSG